MRDDGCDELSSQIRLEEEQRAAANVERKGLEASISECVYRRSDHGS